MYHHYTILTDTLTAANMDFIAWLEEVELG